MSISAFKPDDIVWVKCGALYWPGTVKNFQDLPESITSDFNNTPALTVKFFGEDGYEFLKDAKNVHPYNCPKKEEFIKKGVVKSRTKSKEGATTGWFAKFPNDIVLCEQLTNGDPKLLEKEPYIEKNERVNYKEIFKSHDDSSSSSKSGQKRGSSASTPPRKKAKTANKASPDIKRKINHPRFSGQSDHKVKILEQPSSPYHLDLAMKQEKAKSASNYTCSICGFSATRLNVIVLHNKTHSDKSSSSPSQRRPSSSPGINSSNVSTTSKATPVKRDKIKKETKPKPEKKPKMPAKKVKEILAKEKEKKDEERNKILGDWSDDEDDEKEERTKIKKSLGLASDDEGDYIMDDDNLHQNISDEEESIEVKPQQQSISVTKNATNLDEPEKNGINKEGKNESDKSENYSTNKKQSNDIELETTLNHTKHDKELHETSITNSTIPITSEEPTHIHGSCSKTEASIISQKLEEESKLNETSDSPSASKVLNAKKKSEEDNSLSLLLKETEMPEISMDIGSISKRSSEKRSDKLTNGSSDESLRASRNEQNTEEIDESNSEAKKIRVVETTSNLNDPWDLEDEVMEEKNKSASNSNLKDGGERDVNSKPDISQSFNSQQLLQSEDGETYYLLVDDDGSGAVESLNSQTLYLDPSSLVSGDLSNVVLMSADNSAIVAASSSGVSPSKAVIALDVQQQVVTTVDTSGGVAIVPGMSSGSAKVPLISTQATPPGPLMSTEVTPTTLSSMSFSKK